MLRLNQLSFVERSCNAGSRNLRQTRVSRNRRRVNCIHGGTNIRQPDGETATVAPKTKKTNGIKRHKLPAIAKEFETIQTAGKIKSFSTTAFRAVFLVNSNYQLKTLQHVWSGPTMVKGVGFVESNDEVFEREQSYDRWS